MATLLFTALGTLLGGPLGGALGALAGRQVDALIVGSPTREGPRLKELAVTTSSYGAPMARHYGRMRAPGSIIWATDLVEHRHKEGGGKGKPSTVTYSYTVSFAVALSSRPVLSLGRVWADGNLLRGAAGDLKVGGALRLHSGHGDQPPDPLIQAAEAAGQCPAFRGLAYAVFEDLQLEEFGNRIPALTFEVIADEGTLNLAALFADALDEVDADLPLPGLVGLSCEGPPGEVLAQLDPVYPLGCDAAANALTIAPERLQDAAIPLAEAAVATGEGDFGAGAGFTRRRAGPAASPPGALRYYDIDRDFQPGLQRAPGRPAPGEPRVIELPAALAAADARRLIAAARTRSALGRDSLSWRTSQLDPAVAPGAVVSVPGHPGRWRVEDWEWRAQGVELTLTRLPPSALAAAEPPGGDPGRPNLPADALLAPTALAAFELPWDGTGAGDSPALFAAASSSGAGWKGAALYVDHGDGQLAPLGATGRTRAVLGTALTVLPPASPLLADRGSALTVALLAPNLMLIDATARQLAQGANRALVGEEVIQFGRAVPLGGGVWRLDQLLRGRGGTEGAIAAHGPDEAFVLLDGTPVALDPALVGTAPEARIAALGLADDVPAASTIAGRGVTLRPLCPVHPRRAETAGGGLALAWTRRARGAWLWPDGVDAPLNEQGEAYEVGYGPAEAPLARWTTAVPRLDLAPATLADLAAALPGGSFHVRQIGSHARSEPLLLAHLA